MEADAQELAKDAGAPSPALKSLPKHLNAEMLEQGQASGQIDSRSFEPGFDGLDGNNPEFRRLLTVMMTR